jgi:hypothetical protein
LPSWYSFRCKGTVLALVIIQGKSSIRQSMHSRHKAIVWKEPSSHRDRFEGLKPLHIEKTASPPDVQPIEFILNEKETPPCNPGDAV